MDDAVRRRVLCTGAAALSAIALRKWSGWDSRLYALDNAVGIALRLQEFLAFMREDDDKRMRERADRVTPRNRMMFNWAVSKFGWQQETVKVPVKEGEIPVIVLRPSGGSENLPIIVWYHGGGMVFLGAEDATLASAPVGMGILEHFAGKAIIASVEYRLAPEHKFPTGVEDAIAAAQWMSENATRFGGNRNRLSVAGMSAGGYLAACVHQAARDRGFPLNSAVMVVPMMRRGATTLSFHENGHYHVLPTNAMVWFWNKYAPDPKMADDPRCTPVLGVRQGGLAPCIVATGQYDALRDEGLEHAQALEQAGVPVTRITYRGTHIGPCIDQERRRELLVQWSRLLGIADSKL